LLYDRDKNIFKHDISYSSLPHVLIVVICKCRKQGKGRCLLGVAT